MEAGKRSQYSDWLRTGRPRGRSSNFYRVKNVLHIVQATPGSHISYQMRTGGSFHRVKLPEREADNSPPASAVVKKTWIYTSTPPYAFMS
jgi:hypothetical protein